MDKFCIFCGLRPQAKNKEHVIPTWLMRHTGDPNRTVNLPFLGGPRPFTRSFSSFHFPACESCNNDFFALEASAKSVILRLLDQEELSCDDWDVILDWLDKIRTGLWLGAVYLGGNKIFSVEPQFHIAKRIKSKDRMVVIYRTDCQQSGIGFVGVNTPVFLHSPSCFSLIVNSFAFFSVSTDFLFSRRMGFPYPTRMQVRGYAQIECEMEAGRERIMHPLVKFPYSQLGTQIFQAIFNKKAFNLEHEDLNDRDDIYDTDYVRNFSYDHEKGIGIPLLVRDKHADLYPRTKSLVWHPDHIFPFHEFTSLIFEQTIRTQCHLINESPVSTDKKTKHWASTVNKANIRFLQDFKRQRDQGQLS